MNKAPIIVFAFNRLTPLKACIESLLTNSEATDSDLFVFVDGPRPGKDGEKEKVSQVISYVKEISGFKSLKYHFLETNRGLAASIIDGVSQVMELYGKVIVLEDDLVVGKNFLSFMNQCIDRYEKEARVFSICGYSNIINMPKDYRYDGYFCPRSYSWGWATWKDRWESVDWKLENWDCVKQNAKAFNKWGGSDCFGMLRNWKEGRIQSWAIRFCYSQFIQNKLSLFPRVSHIDNEGFDGQGTNCKRWSRYKFDFDKSDNKNFNLPSEIDVNSKIYRRYMKYHSIPIRIYSRIMYLLFDIKAFFR